jgi:hypothetical protein
MKLGCLIAVGWLTVAGLSAAEALTQVIVELQDGSQLRGSLAPLTLAVDSAALGKLQLGLERIALVNCDGPVAKLALRNGDHLAGKLSLPEIRLQTLVGEMTVPMRQLRQLETLDADGVPTSYMESLIWHPCLEKNAREKVPNDGVPGMDARIVGAKFIPDHRGRTNAALLLTNRLACLEARGDFGKQLANSITISGWIKVEGAHLEDAVCLIGLGSARRAHASLNLGADEGLVWQCGGEDGNGMNQPLDPSDWTFVAGTRDGAALALYINGVQVQTQPAANEPLIGRLDTFVVGSTPQAWGAPAPEVPAADNADPAEAADTPVTKIMVSDIRLYSRALNAQEIQRLYNATRHKPAN